MIALTLPQAATLLDLPVDVLTGWARDGHLITVTSPFDGHTYVEQDHAIDTERAMRRAGTNTPPPTRTPPLPLAALTQWMYEHGHPVTLRALQDWVHRGDLTPTHQGGGRGNPSLYDPYDALTVHATKTPRVGTHLPVVQ